MNGEKKKENCRWEGGNLKIEEKPLPLTNDFLRKSSITKRYTKQYETLNGHVKGETDDFTGTTVRYFH